jgi:hypothetical protein
MHLILHDRLRKALLALKQAPALPLGLITPVEVDERTPATRRHARRAPRPGPPACGHVQALLQLLDRELRRPPDRLVVQHRARTDIEEIGHDALDASWSDVSPFFRPAKRDLTALMQLGVTQKDPIILPSPLRFLRGTTTRVRLRQGLDQIADISIWTQLFLYVLASRTMHSMPMQVLPRERHKFNFGWVLLTGLMPPIS